MQTQILIFIIGIYVGQVHTQHSIDLEEKKKQQDPSNN